MWTGFILACLYVLLRVIGPGLAYVGFHFYRQALAAVAGLGGMVATVFIFQALESQTKLKWLMTSVMALGLVACLLYLGHRAGSRGLVADYCSYGAVSTAQVARCRNRTSIEEIWRSRTNAARFARRKIDQCLVNSGPFCDS